MIVWIATFEYRALPPVLAVADTSLGARAHGLAALGRLPEASLAGRTLSLTEFAPVLSGLPPMPGDALGLDPAWMLEFAVVGTRADLARLMVTPHEVVGAPRDRLRAE